MSNAVPSPSHHRALMLVLGAALVAFALKCAWAFNSSGSSDLLFFFIFGQRLSDIGLAEMYRSDPMFNHTPLTASLVRGLYWMAQGPAAQGQFPPFASAFRFVSALADLGMLAGVLYLRRLTGRPPWWALTLLAASPVSLMVSGFHGNVDPLMVLFLVWAGVALVARRTLLCGVLFALACQVKIVPILLAPLFLGWWWQQDRRGFWRFGIAAAVALLLGSAVPLVQCPGPYLNKVFGYGSYWGTWGFTYWLHQTGAAVFREINFKELTGAQEFVARGLKGVMIVGVLTLAWRRRGVAAPELLTTLAAAFVVIFAFAPGAGPQYLVWIAPFLAWANPRWFAIITGCSTVYMFAFYHSTSYGSFPWEIAFPKGPEIAVWGPWMNVPWLAFLVLLAREARRWWLAEPAPATPAPKVTDARDTPAAA